MEAPVDVCLLIRHRLDELGLEQKDLAKAAEVTESYVSQLLARKKMPPAPERTDIYDKMSRLLKLPPGKLSKLADLQRKDELKRSLSDPPAPLFNEVRELILQKCSPAREAEVRAIFEKQPFGELERLVTQKLLDVVKRVAKEELESENWLRLVAPGHPKRFEFVERPPDQPLEEEPGLREFLRDTSLSGGAAEAEIEFLKSLRFKGRRPTALYYYRELQNLRDPLHFRGPATG